MGDFGLSLPQPEDPSRIQFYLATIPTSDLEIPFFPFSFDYTLLPFILFLFLGGIE